MEQTPGSHLDVIRLDGDIIVKPWRYTALS
jgi:hypothetical protein